MATSSAFANFATLVGVYDGTLYNGVVLDTSTNIGNGDLNLSASSNQYLMNSNSYISPTAITGNGMTFTGWFYPNGAQTINAPIFDISSTTTNSAILLTCSGGTLPNITGSYNGVKLTSNITVPINTWHFFSYIIDCIGTNAYQVLYLDGSYVATNMVATYNGGVVYNNNILGYTGNGTTYFNGKINDFRYYNRVLTPPEINVLYKYNYQSTATVITPIAYVSSDVANLSGSTSIVLDISGTFSYVSIARTATGGSGSAAFNVSCSAMTASSAFTYATWTDTPLTAGYTYTYAITPYILSNLGNTVTVNITI
jgi:hypothetical protein